MRAALLVALVLAVTACGSNGGDGADPPGATVPTAPAATTTTNPYAVPAVIDAAYVSRVVAGLDSLTSDVTRLVVSSKTIPREAFDRLKSVYTDDSLVQREIDLYERDIRQGLTGYKTPLGNQITTVSEVGKVTAGCIYAIATRDYSAVGVNGATARPTWLVLRPIVPGRDPNGYNVTGWAYSFEGRTPEGGAPSNPCAST